MKKTRKRSTKLKLSRETLLRLQPASLREVVGGFSDMIGGTSCYPAECAIDSLEPQLC
jgi:hypothetical protein